jgi:hypothetical protein
MLPVIRSSGARARSPSQQDDGEHSHAENDSGDSGNFDIGNPSSCHAPLLGAVERQR